MALAGAGCSSSSGDSATTLHPRQLRNRAAAVCAGATAAVGGIETPTALAELDGGLAEAGRGLGAAANRLPRLRPPEALEDDFGDLVEHTDELTFQLTLLQEAIRAQDARLAAEELDTTGGSLDDIDDAARALDVPACDSAAWGRGYLQAAGSVIAAEIPATPPVTGDFVTDVNAACMRFAEKFPGGPPTVPENPDDYALLLNQLRDAYDQVANELEVLTPPPGAETDFAALVDLFRTSAATVAGSSQDPAEFGALQAALGELGQQIGPRAEVLGVTCV